MCSIRILFLLFLLPAVFANSSEDNSIFAFKSPSNCRKSEMYDLDYFRCVPCDSAQNLVPSSDHFSCKCAPKTDTDVIYVASEQQPLCNATKCENCDSRAGSKCKQKYVNIMRNGITEKSIQIFYDTSTNCTCDPKLNSKHDDYCISNNILKQHEIYKELKFIVFFCKVLRNITACNHLANLCVSSFYSLAKNSPCSLFLLAQATEAAEYGGEDLKNIRPFLFYKKGKETAQSLERIIDYSYSLREEGSRKGKLEFVGTVYSLQGILNRMGSINKQHLNICNHFLLPKNRYIKFAQDVDSQCQLSLENIIDLAKIYADNNFFSIFLNYTIGNVRYLHPVPILIRNTMSNNENSKPDDWQLVKRFEFISAQQRTYGSDFGPKYDDASKLGYFKSIQFVDNFEIHCTIKEDNKISIPIMMLHYKNIEIYKNSSLTSTYMASFKIKFNKNYSVNFWFEILLPLLIAMGFAFALLRTFNYKTRQNKEFYDFSAFLEFVVYLSSNCANAFFGVAMAVCFYTFLMYTNQSTVKLLLPMQKQDLVEVLIHVAAILKGIYLVHCFWKVGNIDLFFIDWERPRGYDTHLSTKSHFDTPSVCSGISARSLLNEGGVSAWRIFFIANEWIQLSLKRKTSSLVQIVLLLTIMQIIENTLDDKLRDKTIMLTLAALVYVVAYSIQFAYNFLFWKRVSEDPLQQFVNICSIANISVFILLQDCYGFYIHGRSPHGFSDKDISSMIVQLQRESQNISGKRGLLPGSEHQIFVILSPADLRSYYNKLLTPFQRAGNISQVHFEKEFVNHKSHDGYLEKTAVSYNNINRFFCAFIDHAVKDLDYIIKEKSFIENFLDCEFDSYLTDNKGTFYIDNRQSIGKVLLYGNEAQIFLFELFSFLSAFIVTNSISFAIMIMIAAILGFQVIFRNMMKNNLASKTLIDKRFLI